MKNQEKINSQLLEACKIMLEYINWKQPEANYDINLDLVNKVIKEAEQ